MCGQNNGYISTMKTEPYNKIPKSSMNKSSLDNTELREQGTVENS
jgi:hypothetical protein